LLAHASIFLAKVEEQWSLDVFHDNVYAFVDELVVIRYDAVITVLEYLYNAFVLHLMKDMYFFTDIVHSIIHLHVRRRHYFDGELEGGLVDVASEPDLASAAPTDHLYQVICVIESSNCHLLIRGEG
jgi:hypothetical protein